MKNGNFLSQIWLDFDDFELSIHHFFFFTVMLKMKKKKMKKTNKKNNKHFYHLDIKYSDVDIPVFLISLLRYFRVTGLSVLYYNTCGIGLYYYA